MRWLRYGHGSVADNEPTIVSLNGLDGWGLSLIGDEAEDLQKRMQLLCLASGIMLLYTRHIYESGESPLQEPVLLGRFDEQSAASPLRSLYSAEYGWAAHELRFAPPGIQFDAFGRTVTTRLGDIEVNAESASDTGSEPG